jgi:hypothetical protein
MRYLGDRRPGTREQCISLKLSSLEVSTMRIDNNGPNKVYRDFWDWLFYDWHIIFIVGLVLAYFYFLLTTTEV